MSTPAKPPPAATPRRASSVVIPTNWTPEQALAVFELLDELTDRLWALHGSQIQGLLEREQGTAADITASAELSNDDPSF